MNFIHLIYFSPTGNTKRVCQRIAVAIAAQLNFEVKLHDFTSPLKRKFYPRINEGDVLIFGSPVYAGRVPNLMVPYIKGFGFNGAKSVAIVTFGNRHYDDALIELCDLLKSSGASLIGAAAFVGEHSFSRKLAAGRPNYFDLEQAEEFAQKVLDNLCSGGGEVDIVLGGSGATVSLYKPHYQPKFADGTPIDLRKIKPKTSSACVSCKLCVELCPMGAINFHFPSEVEGVCIKCCACVKRCPVGAKYFDSEAFLFHKEELEDNYSPVDRVNEMFF